MSNTDKGSGLKPYIWTPRFMQAVNFVDEKDTVYYSKADIDARDAAALEGVTEAEREALDHVERIKSQVVVRHAAPIFTHAVILASLARCLLSARATPAEVVSVKPLEWREDRGGWYAWTSWTDYTITNSETEWPFVLRPFPYGGQSNYKTVEEAKAAAYEDLCKRINNHLNAPTMETP